MSLDKERDFWIYLTQTRDGNRMVRDEIMKSIKIPMNLEEYRMSSYDYFINGRVSNRLQEIINEQRHNGNGMWYKRSVALKSSIDWETIYGSLLGFVVSDAMMSQDYNNNMAIVNNRKLNGCLTLGLGQTSWVSELMMLRFNNMIRNDITEEYVKFAESLAYKEARPEFMLEFMIPPESASLLSARTINNSFRRFKNIYKKLIGSVEPFVEIKNPNLPYGGCFARLLPLSLSKDNTINRLIIDTWSTDPNIHAFQSMLILSNMIKMFASGCGIEEVLSHPRDIMNEHVDAWKNAHRHDYPMERSTEHRSNFIYLDAIHWSVIGIKYSSLREGLNVLWDWRNEVGRDLDIGIMCTYASLIGLFNGLAYKLYMLADDVIAENLRIVSECDIKNKIGIDISWNPDVSIFEGMVDQWSR